MFKKEKQRNGQRNKRRNRIIQCYQGKIVEHLMGLEVKMKGFSAHSLELLQQIRNIRVFNQPFGKKFIFNGFGTFVKVLCWLMGGIKRSRMAINTDDKALYTYTHIYIIYLYNHIYDCGNYGLNSISQGKDSSSSRITFQKILLTQISFTYNSMKNKVQRKT